ncbi:MAG: hypothetical protein OXN95_13515 [bacterium]|nr:hypothetical protein [bacterium]
MRRLLAIMIAAALVLGGSAAAQDTETEQQQPGFVVTEELLAALLEWLCSTNSDALPEGACAVVEPEPDPQPTATPAPPVDDPSPEETLAYWQQPGQTAAVDTQYACLIGSYHHTCTTWVNGEGHRVTCTTPGCDPTK